MLTTISIYKWLYFDSGEEGDENVSPDPSQSKTAAQSSTHPDDVMETESTQAPSVHLPEPGDVGMELVPPEVQLAPVNSSMSLWDEEILLEWWQVDCC